MRANRMPFGKFKGWPVDEIPAGYLNWLVDTVDLREPLKSAVENALELRGPATTHQEAIRSIYRRLSLRWHPDHGGSTEAQAAINQFYEELATHEKS